MKTIDMAGHVLGETQSICPVCQQTCKGILHRQKLKKSPQSAVTENRRYAAMKHHAAQLRRRRQKNAAAEIPVRLTAVWTLLAAAGYILSRNARITVYSGRLLRKMRRTTCAG